MKNLNHYVAIYKEQLQKGDILIAYEALVKFVMQIRTDCMKEFGDLYSFTGILHGYMDYTYFYYSNAFLKNKKLKLGFVLNHVEMRFELWLLGNTKSIQKRYWERLKDSKWNKNRKEMPKYSIIEITVIEHPDFDSLDKLSETLKNNFFDTSKNIINELEKVLD